MRRVRKEIELPVDVSASSSSSAPFCHSIRRAHRTEPLIDRETPVFSLSPREKAKNIPPIFPKNASSSPSLSSTSSPTSRETDRHRSFPLVFKSYRVLPSPGGGIYKSTPIFSLSRGARSKTAITVTPIFTPSSLLGQLRSHGQPTTALSLRTIREVWRKRSRRLSRLITN